MTIEIPQKFAERLDKAQYVWFTTVRADGMPQPTPVWFIREQDGFVVYSMPDAQKVKNIRQNPKVALSFTESPDAEDYLVVMGEATLDPKAPAPATTSPYMVKYAQGIKDLGMTDEGFTTAFTTAIRVTPTRVRGE
ncbi:MAG: TIGR03667 family PPOX class F420-dependent oxidoreductase [Chloroflexota bacterium]|nr:TIGR03667 family PPOX class F420-dependent oxidoreductase [Chloroflexota bacterium]